MRHFNQTKNFPSLLFLASLLVIGAGNCLNTSPVPRPTKNPCEAAMALMAKAGKAPQASQASLASTAGSVYASQPNPAGGSPFDLTTYPAMNHQNWTPTWNISLFSNFEIDTPFPPWANAIGFYDKDKDYYQFTNFWAAPICIEGDDKPWPGTEWYFQAQKFTPQGDANDAKRTQIREQIRAQEFPSKAFSIANDQSNSKLKRPDWNSARFDVMLEALWAKFNQHPDLKARLLDSRLQDKWIVEASPFDSLWGYGANQQGLNHLGQMLMHIRDILHGTKAVATDYEWVKPSPSAQVLPPTW